MSKSAASFSADAQTLASEIQAVAARVAAAANRGEAVNPEDAVMLRGSAEALLVAAAGSMRLVPLEPLQPASDVLHANQDRVRDPQEPCAVCGKGVKDVFKYQVHLSCQGNIYPVSIDVDTAQQLPEGTMYFSAVGPDCAKKIPAGYLHTA